MLKYIFSIAALLMSIPCFAQTTITNGTLSMGIDETRGYVITSFSLNSNGVNLMPSDPSLPGWQGIMSLYGPPDPNLVESNPNKVGTDTTEAVYGTTDNYYWNINEQSNSHNLDYQAGTFPHCVMM